MRLNFVENSLATVWIFRPKILRILEFKQIASVFSYQQQQQASISFVWKTMFNELRHTCMTYLSVDRVLLLDTLSIKNMWKNRAKNLQTLHKFRCVSNVVVVRLLKNCSMCNLIETFFYRFHSCRAGVVSSQNVYRWCKDKIRARFDFFGFCVRSAARVVMLDWIECEGGWKTREEKAQVKGGRKI